MKSTLLINGSPSGSLGNTALLLRTAAAHLRPRLEVNYLHLSELKSIAEIEPILREADSFLFATGTYWDSWGSPLQRFLEDATSTEGSELWLGKPAAVAVLMHSVGGKGVLSRLQGVLNTFGLAIPPMSGMVYSAANQLALKMPETDLSTDLWRPSDLEVVCHNLAEACLASNQWKSWPVDQQAFEKIWLEMD